MVSTRRYDIASSLIDRAYTQNDPVHIMKAVAATNL